jgi:spermidine synthase
MSAWEIVDNAATEDGTVLVLAREGAFWEVRTGHHMLMASEPHISEDALAVLALARSPHAKRVLIGGLGLGYSLRAALDLLSADARVVIAETSSALVRWNRTVLKDLAKAPLEDPRVELRMGDVGERIAESPGSYDVIMLDVDNGPVALVHESNSLLYDEAGIAACASALVPGGVLAVWSSHPNDEFLERLSRGGFEAEAHAISDTGADCGEHVVFIGVKRIAPARS